VELLYTHCAGIDVHQNSLSVCALTPGSGVADEPSLELRSFGTFTNELLLLCEWLKQVGITHVAMESTGIYWKPVWNVLEPHFTVILANAQHIKNVPGRKTDKADCQWIARLLRHGLLKPSFIPEIRIRQLRDLCRTRTSLTRQKTAVVNRLQKVLEDANIKLGSVATDVMGVSGRSMLRQMIAGKTDPMFLADLARGPMRKKLDTLRMALTGTLTPHHRFLLKQHLLQSEELEKEIRVLKGEIADRVVPFEALVTLWMTIPGIDRIAAWGLLAEVGAEMDQFPSARHLVSWAGLCPGNNESAGKRKSSRTRKANPWLRGLMTQIAWAAAHTKETYLSQQYRRLLVKRGKKRALLAVANTILTIVWHIGKHGRPYRELGADYLDRLKGSQAQRYHVRKLEKMGLQVTITPTSQPV
jgi:transposase